MAERLFIIPTGMAETESVAWVNGSMFRDHIAELLEKRVGPALPGQKLDDLADEIVGLLDTLARPQHTHPWEEPPENRPWSDDG